MIRSLKIFHSHDEQDQADREYWKSLSGEQKLEILEAIRMQYWAFKNEHPQRLDEFVALLNDKQVRYLVIGGYAVGFHSRPKFTDDIDIWIDNSLENAEKVLAVLNEFGFSELDITVNDLMDADNVIQLGYAPVRIDIITGLGIDFAAAYTRRVTGTYLDIATCFISRDDLIASKKAAGRAKDLADIDWINHYSD